MSRQVDVKALVSHIVRGDGSDKCRICMGDTTDGQVYLGDTVTMEGDRPVTLSELLETITGIEVRLEEGLPPGLCPSCHEIVQTTVSFRSLCQQSSHHWTKTMELLSMLPDPSEVAHANSIYAVINNDEITVYDNIIEEDGINSSNESVIEISDIDTNVLKYADAEKKFKRPLLRENNKGKHKFSCPDCGKIFPCPMLMHQHLMGSTDSKRSCYLCAEIMSQDKLVEHLERVHHSSPHVCDKCSALFQFSLHLNQHMKTAHAPGSHFCGECGKSFPSKYAFHGHLTVHIAKNCPVCEKLFRNHRCYLYHIKFVCNLNKKASNVHKTKHRVVYEVINKNYKKIRVGLRGSSETECICDYCGKKFAGKKTVTAHIQIVHMKNTHKPCPHCGKFYAAAHMPTHIQKHIKAPDTFKCEYCSVKLKTKLGYIQHIRLHTGETPYRCKFCSKTFSASSRRSEHVRKIHRKIETKDLKHVCHLCPARFRLPYRLKKHLADVHSDLETKVVEYECTVCHIKFATCRGLVNHGRQHKTV